MSQVEHSTSRRPESAGPARSGAPAPGRAPALPCDGPDPGAAGRLDARECFLLEAPLRECLLRSNGEPHAALVPLLAAYALLLHRLSGQERLLLAASAGRAALPEKGMRSGPPKGSPGTGWRVLQSPAPGQETVAAYLEALRREYENSSPQEGIPAAVGVLFSLTQADEEPGLEGEESAGSVFLSLQVVRRGEEVELRCAYSTRRFQPGTVRRWLGYYRTLLDGLLADPQAPAAALSLLGPEERRQLLCGWNRTETEYPRDRCIHHLFEEQAARRPEAVAVVTESERLTYSELNRRANQVAHWLRALPAGGGAGAVGPGTRIGLCLDRSASLVVGLLGIMKAGAAYVPLDPEYPRERLRAILEAADVSAILTRSSLLGRLPEQGAPALCLDREEGALERRSAENPETPVTAEDLAYVIFTSGSTGQPKGVQLPHRAVVNFLLSMHERPGMTCRDTHLGVASVSFDASVLDFYVPLTAGARLALVSRDTCRDGRRLAEALESHAATVAHATPSTWRMLVQSGWRGDGRLKILSGGEALPPDLAGELVKRGGSLWNLYGPTETAVYSAVEQVTSGEGPVFLGEPIRNTRLYVVDTHLQPQPPGVPGELCIGGDGVARGYLGQPGLTAERFVRDPFYDGAEGRMYRTGDLATRRPDGRLEFLGRLDHQVKIRGHRIEPGEIEAALRRHPAVREAAVVPWEETPGEPRLVAYFVSGTAATPEELRLFLKERLPEYLLPSFFVPLEELPLTPNGKLDRAALPQPPSGRARSTRDATTPRDDLERRLAHLWEEVLRVRPIGVREDFFALGGHSLLAARIFAEMETRFGKSLPVSALFQAPTIEQLAALLREGGWAPRWSSLVPLQPSGSRLPLYCLHHTDGHVLCYRDLANRLGPDQPVYGVQPRSLGGEFPPHRTVEEMAEYYLEEIRTLQPEGPYHLCGASFGGTIALEMARQLRARGQETGLLALVDTYGPGYLARGKGLSGLRKQLARLPIMIDHHAGSLLLLERGRRVSYLLHKLERLRVRRRERQLPERLDQTRRAIEEAEGAYTPQPCGSRITLFRTRHQPPGTLPDPSLGWGPYAAGGLEVLELPGFHAAVLAEPRVRFLAAGLRACLDRCAEAAACRPAPTPEAVPGRRPRTQAPASEVPSA